MDLNLSKETIAVKEIVLENCYEQAVETDYILPDYYPDIFRVIKCRIMPRIVSHSIVGNDSSGDTKKLSYDIEALIRVWYLSENSKTIHCVEQKMKFSKAVDVSLTGNSPEICINPKTDYINCRVINQRRLDIRGAISTKIKICDEKNQSIVSDAAGDNVQLKKSLINFPAVRLVSSKKITVIEELELGIAKPPILSVIKSDCRILTKEHKAISNKLVVKGETQIDMLYTCSKDDEHGIENMRFTIPFSQIIDIDGIDETFDIDVDITTSGCDIITKGSGESTSFECEMVLLVSCVATKSMTSDIIEDAYSTSYECEIVTEDLKYDTPHRAVSDKIPCKNTLNTNDCEIAEVIDCSCEVTNISSHISVENNSFIINGNVCFSALIASKEGFPLMIEADSIFEHNIDCGTVAENCLFEPKVSVCGCSFNLSGDSSVEIIADILIEGTILEKNLRKVIKDIRINKDNKKDINSSSALKLYYADENEDIWEIAKKNSTSVQAIIDENNIAADRLTEKGMLLIPIIN